MRAVSRDGSGWRDGSVWAEGEPVEVRAEQPVVDLAGPLGNP